MATHSSADFSTIRQPTKGDSGKYHLDAMPTNTYRYRLWRSLHLFEHIGLQYIWLEDNPEQFHWPDASMTCKHCGAPAPPFVDIGPLTAGRVASVNGAGPPHPA